MRLIEKMAHDWVREGDDVWIDDGYSPHENSFIAGFRAAREMAAESIVLIESDTKTQWHWEIAEYIRNLGEQEIGDKSGAI